MFVEPLRHAVAIARCVPGARLLLDLTHGGQLVVGAGPGVYRSSDASLWCFATTLDHEAVHQVVVSVDADPALAAKTSAIDTVIKPDPCLGTTVVVVFGGAPEQLNDVVGRIAGGCLAIEASAPLPAR